MNSSCLILLALALLGVVANAYVAPVYSSVGYNGYCRGEYGLGYESGYGSGCGCGCGGYCGGACGGSCGGVCGSGCGATVCDTCQCVKTVVRPPYVERIPYTCTRRIQSNGCGPYRRNGYIGGGYCGYATDIVV